MLVPLCSRINENRNTYDNNDILWSLCRVFKTSLRLFLNETECWNVSNDSFNLLSLMWTLLTFSLESVTLTSAPPKVLHYLHNCTHSIQPLSQACTFLSCAVIWSRTSKILTESTLHTITIRWWTSTDFTSLLFMTSNDNLDRKEQFPFIQKQRWETYF